ncbi:MAG: glutamate-5-semialdehyde dehydrogenase, partial [Bacteroidaceae bacterium]|nr:glutamate-5-semialdehyde dehydrogenase [Bacteroidaceae bacterium]
MMMNDIFIKTREASRRFAAFAGEEQINDVLMALADELELSSKDILDANAADLARMDASDPKYDRLQLSEFRIKGIAAGVRNVATLPAPMGRLLEETVRPNGMRLKKVAVPFGVVGVIYEARPNVTVDVFSLCLKSGNACILKGGSDADSSNRAMMDVIHRVLRKYGMDEHLAPLLPAGHDSTAELLGARGFVDVIIPRGGRGLIDYVRRNATVPVIETGAGVCHTYFDASGDISMGCAIVKNAKTRRVSVCNALDCLLVHRSRVEELPRLCSALSDSNVVIYADAVAYGVLEGKYPHSLLEHASDDSFGTEYLDYKLSVRVVDGVEEAVAHIASFGSGHSE